MKKFFISQNNVTVKLPSYFSEVWYDQQLTGKKILRGYYYKNGYVHPDLVVDGKCNGYQLKAEYNEETVSVKHNTESNIGLMYDAIIKLENSEFIDLLKCANAIKADENLFKMVIVYIQSMSLKNLILHMYSLRGEMNRHYLWRKNSYNEVSFNTENVRDKAIYISKFMETFENVIDKISRENTIVNNGQSIRSIIESIKWKFGNKPTVNIKHEVEYFVKRFTFYTKSDIYIDNIKAFPILGKILDNNNRKNQKLIKAFSKNEDLKNIFEQLFGFKI